MNDALGVIGALLLVAGVTTGLTAQSEAARYTSPNYTIDASIDNSFGGSSTGGSYQLVASGGESIVGNGAGGSYVLDHGYVAQLANSLQLTVEPSSASFNQTITPGVSQIAEAEASIVTDAPGYHIAVSQAGELSDGSHAIAGISGATITSPVAWNESVTKGLGVTLVSASATALPGKWNNGNSYAALPSTATTIYSRSGFTSGGTDTVTIRYRLDVPATQPTGAYTTTVTYTGTMLP